MPLLFGGAIIVNFLKLSMGFHFTVESASTVGRQSLFPDDEKSPCLLFSCGAFDPAPRGTGLVHLRQFGVLLGVTSSGAQVFAGLARVELQFSAELLQGDDVGH